MTTLFTLILGAAALQPSPSPSQFADEWLAALNRRDFPALVAFHRKAGWTSEPEEPAGQDFALARRGGRLERVRDLKAAAASSEILIRLVAPDEYLVLTVSRNPQGILQPSIRPAVRAELKEVPLATRETLAGRIRSHADRLGRSSRFRGAYAVLLKGKPIASGHYGLAHEGFRAPNRANTKFNLASMGKMFTAVTVGRLVEQGKLSWDAKVGEVLPEYPNKEVREKVTVRMLLAHRSGLADMFTEEFQQGSKDRWKTVDQLLTLFQDRPVEFEPGTQSRYSNAGYVLLGKIIEKVTGEDYWGFLRRTLFTPLGMKDTDAFELDSDTPNLAIGYTHDDFGQPVLTEAPKNNLFMHIAKGSPAGGCFSTVPDLAKFAAALRQGQIVRPDTLREMTKPSGSPPPYGLGFQLRQVAGETAYGHSGGFPGINGELTILPKADLTIIALANYDGQASALAARIRMFINDAYGPAPQGSRQP